MIPEADRKTNSDATQQTRSLAKKVIGLLPSGTPARIYNAILKVPIARDIVGAAVRSAIPEKITANGCVIFLDQQDIAVSGSLALTSFESFETDLFRQTLRPRMNVVDIGAHIGYYSLLASKQIGNGKVFSFEPEPKNFTLLTKNIAANGITNVIATNTALSDSSGERELFIEKYNKGHHSFGKNEHSIGKVTVKTCTLDAFLHQYGDPIIDVLKIDIEGAEPIALRGMKETLARSPNLVIFTEVYPRCMEKLGESAEAYLDELVKLGFSLSVIEENEKKVLPIKDVCDFLASFPSGEAFRNVIARKTKGKEAR